MRYVERDEEGVETVVYRASGLGACVRALVACGSGYDPVPHPDWFQEILNEGHQYEAVILEGFENQEDTRVVERQKEVELEIGEIEGRRVIVRGHIDGMEDGLLPVPVDAKKIRLSQWASYLLSGVEYIAGWPWQIATYMYALDAGEFVLVGGCLDGGRITEIHTIRVTNPPVPLRAIKMKIAKVEGLIATEDVTVECGPRMYPCPWYYLHDAGDQEEPPQRIEVELMVEYANKFRSVQQTMDSYTRALKELDKEKRRITEGMRGWLEANGMRDLEKMVVGDVEVKRVRYPRKEYTVKAGEVDYFSVKRSVVESTTTKPDTGEGGKEDSMKDGNFETDSVNLEGLKGSSKKSGVGVPKPRKKTEG